MGRVGAVRRVLEILILRQLELMLTHRTEGSAALEDVDALCAVWAVGRDEALGRAIEEQGYVAAQPVNVRVLSALRADKGKSVAQDGATIQAFAEALRDSDPVLARRAEATLRALDDQRAVDALCAIWVRGRDEKLGRIIEDRGYVAAQPVEVRVLSALRANKGMSLAEEVPALQSLVEAAQDADVVLAQRAEATLRALSAPELRTALCRLAVSSPMSVAAKICIEYGWRPPDPEEACLFLFVTRQLDAYFGEDYEFQNLLLQYDRADATVRGHVMDVARSGDRRCAGFFLGAGGGLGGTRKPLSECTDHEVQYAIESGLRHQDWPWLFRAFLGLPLKYGFRLLGPLRRSGWEPDTDELRRLCTQLLLVGQDNPETLPPEPETQFEADCPFERWLAEGRTGALAAMDGTELVARLDTATPPEGVAIVAALASKCEPGRPVAGKIRQNPHALVQFAGYAMGLCTPDASGDQMDNAWCWSETTQDWVGIEQEFWPAKATPADLDTIRLMPRTAGMGKMGAMRRVLETLITHRMEGTSTFEEVTIEVGEFDGEFEEAD